MNNTDMTDVQALTIAILALNTLDSPEATDETGMMLLDLAGTDAIDVLDRMRDKAQDAVDGMGDPDDYGLAVHFGIVQSVPGVMPNFDGATSTMPEKMWVVGVGSLFTDGNWKEWGERDNASSLHLVYNVQEADHLADEILVARNFIFTFIVTGQLVPYVHITSQHEYNDLRGFAALDQGDRVFVVLDGRR